MCVCAECVKRELCAQELRNPIANGESKHPAIVSEVNLFYA